ncbi:MAG: SpoIVB peptidase [Ruminococcaceae bacterium]|nr:SpoIVB peptidase [Oscillospiraceae bacterium]
MNGKKSLRIYLSFLLTAVLFFTVLCLAYYRNTDGEVLEASLFNYGKEDIKENETVSANETELKLVPLGTVFGIKLFTDGVIVTGTEKIESGNAYGSFSPAYDAGIRKGDYIVEAEGEVIDSNSELSKIIRTNEDESILLKVRRGSEIFETEVMLLKNKGVKMAGMWIRDSAAGIGTLTYYNPETKEFGGLGHGIIDMDIKEVMDIKGGVPENIVLTSIDKGVKGVPGKLNGFFSGEAPIGELTLNCETGIYGTLSEEISGEAVPVADKNEVEINKAQIIATIDASGPQYFDVFIEEIIDKERDTKNFVVKITDEYLIEKTGGIIQGLSGSPIIQNGKLIGAVTHVFLEDPKRGYGIFIENMLEAAV